MTVWELIVIVATIINVVDNIVLAALMISDRRSSNVEEAKRLSESAFTDADFGEASDIDGEPIIVEDENGDFVWEASLYEDN